MNQLIELKYELIPQIKFRKTGKVLTGSEAYLLDPFKIWLKRFFKSRIQSGKYILATLGLTHHRLEL